MRWIFLHIHFWFKVSVPPLCNGDLLSTTTVQLSLPCNQLNTRLWLRWHRCGLVYFFGGSVGVVTKSESLLCWKCAVLARWHPGALTSWCDLLSPSSLELTNVIKISCGEWSRCLLCIVTWLHDSSSFCHLCAAEVCTFYSSYSLVQMLPMLYFSKLFSICSSPCECSLVPVNHCPTRLHCLFLCKFAVAEWLWGLKQCTEVQVLNRLRTVTRWHQENQKKNPVLREIWVRWEKTRRSSILQRLGSSFATNVTLQTARMVQPLTAYSKRPASVASANTFLLPLWDFPLLSWFAPSATSIGVVSL